MADDGMTLFVKVAIPDDFLESERIYQEFDIRGGGARDAIMTAHDQSLDLIIQQHGDLPITYNDPHVIHLPFHCEQSYTKKLIWIRGDQELAQEFYEATVPKPPQLCGVLRVFLASIEKSLSISMAFDEEQFTDKTQRFADRYGCPRFRRDGGGGGFGNGGSGGG